MLPTNIGKCRIKLSALGMGCWPLEAPGGGPMAGRWVGAR